MADTWHPLVIPLWVHIFSKLGLFYSCAQQKGGSRSKTHANGRYLTSDIRSEQGLTLRSHEWPQPWCYVAVQVTSLTASCFFLALQSPYGFIFSTLQRYILYLRNKRVEVEKIHLNTILLHNGSSNLRQETPSELARWGRNGAIPSVVKHYIILLSFSL